MPTEYRKALEAMKPRQIAPHPPEHADIAVGVTGQ
jgi:hypothetical protein